jgi:hypothetical protein
MENDRCTPLRRKIIVGFYCEKLRSYFDLLKIPRLWELHSINRGRPKWTLVEKKVNYEDLRVWLSPTHITEFEPAVGGHGQDCGRCRSNSVPPIVSVLIDCNDELVHLSGGTSFFGRSSFCPVLKKSKLRVRGIF